MQTWAGTISLTCLFQAKAPVLLGGQDWVPVGTAGPEETRHCWAEQEELGEGGKPCGGARRVKGSRKAGTDKGKGASWKGCWESERKLGGSAASPSLSSGAQVLSAPKKMPPLPSVPGSSWVAVGSRTAR